MPHDPAYLLDILMAAQKVRQFTGELTYEQFEQNEILQLAIIRLVEIMGEAARSISRQTKDAHPEIPWRGITGMRNRLIHEYFHVNLKKVWDVVQNDIPALITQIEPLIPPEEEA